MTKNYTNIKMYISLFSSSSIIFTILLLNAMKHFKARMFDICEFTHILNRTRILTLYGYIQIIRFIEVLILPSINPFLHDILIYVKLNETVFINYIFTRSSVTLKSLFSCMNNFSSRVFHKYFV